MEIITEAENYKAEKKTLLLALGNFDGIHLGHQKLITTMVQEAKKIKGIAAAFIFNPHPALILKPDKAPRMLINIEKKSQLLQQLGLNLLIYHTFTPEIALWTPEEFVQEILVNTFKVNQVFVGFNYSFGYLGKGNPEILAQLGCKYGFKVVVIPPVTIEGEIVSSSLIRCYIEQGEVNKLCKLVGITNLASIDCL